MEIFLNAPTIISIVRRSKPKLTVVRQPCTIHLLLSFVVMVLINEVSRIESYSSMENVLMNKVVMNKKLCNSQSGCKGL